MNIINIHVHAIQTTTIYTADKMVHEIQMRFQDFSPGGPTFADIITELQSLSTFKHMLAVCICFNKRYML